MDNHTLITNGFDILLKALVPFEVQELVKAYGQDWWQRGVYGKLYEDQRRDLPETGRGEELVSSIDMAKALLLLEINWNEVFRKVLPRDCKNWAIELKGTRNKWAHPGIDGISDSDTWRALDTMSRLCGQINTEAEARVNALLRQARYGSEQGSVAATSNAQAPASKSRKAPETVAASGLPSWRDVMEPHQDVAEGRYRNAEFAADLAQVARNEGSLEYRDPIEFFGRTYVTEGMKGLLVQALRRVAGLDGEPVIQLKTAFGGGKTHSMLALYHMLRSRTLLNQIPNVAHVLEAAGLSEVPEVHVAVIVGTALNPAKAKRPADMSGITVNTIWGEIAYQLSKSSGKPELYEYVREADRRGVSPGSEALAEMFDACGCALVLVDELVAYAKKLFGVEKLPAGTFDNFITFVQELTEAARASKRSIVVASIPESDREIGGESGQRALEAIEHTFGRMESIWKPVSASEGFEVVRRRLFLDCKDVAARDAVCNAFSKMYAANSADFPVDARELEYRDRMVRCYPIHPEVFDRLYEDWATLETFQRTRGVLRLMAAVIHELWMSHDESPMIMPGSLPLDVPNVRDELTRYLDENWNGVVDSEIDGKSSVPYKNDQANSRYGRVLASRRVSRTIMLGSAPDVSGQNARGIERTHIRLGVVQPGENIAVFNDALSTLQASSSFLYSDGSSNRYWYDTRPTLRKVMEDRAQQLNRADALYEIEQRLKDLRKTAPFSGLHVCPTNTLDVPDEMTLRLVVLPPSAPHRGGSKDSAAIKLADEILSMRGTTPRRFKNMLAFVACDGGSAGALEQAARTYLAWQSISDDREQLNLDIAQQRETEQGMRRADQTLSTRIQEAYSWLMAPRVDLTSGSMDIAWETDRIAGGGEDVVHKAASKLVSNEAAITQWAPALLRMELDRVLWKDKRDIQIKQLWEYLCTYCYLSRLAGYNVLETAILQGLSSKEFFGIADGVGEDRYLNLSFGEARAQVNQSDFLVKPAVAEEQIEREAGEGAVGGKPWGGGERAEVPDSPGGPLGGGSGPAGGGSGDVGHDGTGTSAGGVPARNMPTSFTMSTKLDNTRVILNVRTIVEEIVSQLEQVDGAEVELTLEVRSRAESGIPVPTQRAVSENCNTLHISDYRFDG
ncbi:DUF499 domain-containing protein [Thermophilibacter mediterraneus]|uniref:DUF499 domain-containing protein n=1 Tax=Thermophilibacter mediterraneus TaxID=1871031 RepID=UPI002357A375|nr:DUF499 domain-containing protein [Thermophilibacter mediterraneus]